MNKQNSTRKIYIATPFQEFRESLAGVLRRASEQYERANLQVDQNLQEATLLLLCFPPKQALEFLEDHLPELLRSAPQLGFLVLEKGSCIQRLWEEPLEDHFGKPIRSVTRFFQLLDSSDLSNIWDPEKWLIPGQDKRKEAWEGVGAHWARRMWGEFMHLNPTTMEIQQLAEWVKRLEEWKGYLNESQRERLGALAGLVKRKEELGEWEFRDEFISILKGRPSGRAPALKLPQAQSARIGLIEDNESDKGKVHKILQGFQVVDLDYRLDSSRLAESHAQGLDLLIVDLHLGKDTSQGIEFIREFREKSKTLPILVLTGYDDPSLMEESREAGADYFILKTEMDQELSSWVRWYLAPRRVVIVEDEPDSLRLLTEELEKQGYALMGCQSIDEFQQGVLGRLHTLRVNLVVLDIYFQGRPEGLKVLDSMGDILVAVVTQARDPETARTVTYRDRRRLFVRKDQLNQGGIERILRLLSPPKRLELVVNGVKIKLDDREIPLQPAQWAFVYVLARRGCIRKGKKLEESVWAEYEDAYGKVESHKSAPNPTIPPLVTSINKRVQKGTGWQGWRLIEIGKATYYLNDSLEDKRLP